jgi:hypothetical protein
LISRVAVGLSVICTELLDLQFRGGGSSCKFGGDDEEKIINSTAIFAGYFYTLQL